MKRAKSNRRVEIPWDKVASDYVDNWYTDQPPRKSSAKPLFPKRPKSNLEETLAMQLKAAGIPFDREYRFDDTRRFRFDFVVRDHPDWIATTKHLAVECEGSIWVKGRHNTGAGMMKDMEKYNLAVELGWRVLRYTMAQIKSGEALAQIERCLE